MLNRNIPQPIYHRNTAPQRPEVGMIIQIFIFYLEG